MYRFLFIFLGFSCLFSCTDNKSVEKDNSESVWTRKESTTLNKRLAQEDEVNIRLFLKRHKEWEMQSTGTGLQYWIYRDKDGVTAKKGDVVDVWFSIQKLDETVLYETEEGELSNFKVDQSHVESGVMEGIKKMAEGERAKLIIPSHLGHGLLGDSRKIPPLQVLLVDIELVKIY
jgi:FKBP-type peptidyl-prolyl cis-trans isomerase